MESTHDTSNCASGGEETLRFFEKAYECTEEDLKYKFTEDQLKEICLKHKCHVMASRWNIVYEYGLWLKKEGRFEGRSSQYERRMVTKGVNRHKSRLLYDEETIQKTLEEEWRFRKKDNILSLRLWERDRQQNERNECEPPNGEEDQAHHGSSDNTDEDEFDTDASEYLDKEEALDDSEYPDKEEGRNSPMIREEEQPHHGSTDNTDDGDDVMMGNISIDPLIYDTDGGESQSAPGNCYEEGHHSMEAVCDDLPVISSDPKAINDIGLEVFIESEAAVQRETTYTGSEEIDGLFDVNTESMTMIESRTASLLNTQSEDIFSDDFNKEIPCTSTQKESEEILAD